jgi:hypothetical protein
MLGDYYPVQGVIWMLPASRALVNAASAAARLGYRLKQAPATPTTSGDTVALDLD